MRNKTLFSMLLLSNILTSPLSMSAQIMDTVKLDSDAREIKVIKLPQTIRTYTSVNNDWEINRQYKTKWNNFNKIAEEVQTYYKNGIYSFDEYTVNEYNNDGNITNSTMQSRYTPEDPWTNETMHTYQYDEVDPSFAYLDNYYKWNWMYEEWETSYASGYYYEIGRDENNRVLSRSKYQSISYDMIDEYIEFTYKKAQKTAVSISVSLLDEYYETVPARFYDNIVWKRSNENYLRTRDSRYFMWTGDVNNLMRSCDLYTYNEYGDLEFDSHLNNVFTDTYQIKQSSVFSHDGVHIMNAYDYDTTPNGGYIYYYFYWNDLNGNKEFEKGEENLNFYAERVERKFDEHGNLVVLECKRYNEKTLKFDNLKYLQTYDYEYLEDGTIKEYVFTLYDQNGNIGKCEKFVYDDFVDSTPTSVEEFMADVNIDVRNGYVKTPVGLPYSIVDIQGHVLKSGVSSSEVSYEDLPSGLYIISVGNKQVKVMK